MTKKLKKSFILLMSMMMILGGIISMIPPKANALVTVNKKWGVDITDEMLNEWNGQSMPCTVYVKKAVEKYYGISFPGGVASNQERWLKANAKPVARADIKPGDIICFSGEHTAIMGSGGRLHHGGIGPGGLVVWKYGIDQVNWTGSSGDYSGAYRLLADNVKVKVKKQTTANKAIVEVCKNSYSLAGATYGVYKTEAAAKAGGNDYVKTITTTDNDGNAPTLELPAASTYYLREIQAPKGYMLDTTVHPVDTSSGEGSVNVGDKPQYDPVAVLLSKISAETGKPVAQGGASLGGAEYTFELFDNLDCSGNYIKKWVFKSDKDGIVLANKDSLVEDKSDSLFINNKNEIIFPANSSLKIYETKAPKGYLINDEIYKVTIPEVENSLSEVIRTYNKGNEDLTSKEQVKRGGFRFNKIKDGKDSKGLAGIPFEVISKTTGEKHVIVSDKNGLVDTEAVKDPAKVNLNDSLNVEEMSADNGVWFSGSSSDKVDPSSDKFALPYDTYEIKELRCKANKGLKLADFTITISKDKTSIDRGTVTDDKDIDIKSEFKDENTKLHITSALNTNVTINDKMWYRNAEQDSEYIIRGKLVDKDNPDTVVAKGASEKFTCWTSAGETKVPFKFDATKYRGKKLVALQTMYEIKNGKEIKVAEDVRLDNPSQTINIPDIGTEAAFAEIDTIVDTVSYKNLIPGKEYTMKASLMDKDGKETGITAEAKFTPETENGTVDVTLKGKDMAGKTFVVYEELWYGKTQLVDHKDKTDKKQTVKVPEIKTEARDQKDGDKAIMGEPNQTITDTLTYKNLTPGKKYTIEENLADPNTGKLLIDEKTNKPIVATKEFTPEKENGTVSIDITFDATKQQAQKVVAFAKIVEINAKGETKVIAQHLDKDDPKQQVDVYMELSVSIAKGDAKNEKYRLKGAEITIFNEKGEIVKDKDGKPCVGVTDKNGEVKFTLLYLKDNKFYAKETKAPNGYHLNKNKFPVKPKTFDKEGADIKISILDEAIIIPPKGPKTGDTNSMSVALGGLGLATAGLGVALKKRKLNK